jgi:AmmeMemoRadiSam system protein A
MNGQLTDELRGLLLDLARQSISHGMEHAQPLPVDACDAPPCLREVRASFVTLTQDGRLRGCIGSLEAYRMLIEDIVGNAHAAAFRDPRFPPLCASEVVRTRLTVSILSVPVPMSFGSESDLICQLRPGTVGLILRGGGRRATFLPAVWATIPAPAEFVRELKRKAGIGLWDTRRRLQVWRYVTESFSE